MAESPQAPSSKRDALLVLLERGMVMMHLDARREGVDVPADLAVEAHLRLNLSYRFLLDDLVIDDSGVSATLSFGGQPRHCAVPWTAIFALTRAGTAEGWLWPNDLPPEVLLSTVEATDVGAPPTALANNRPAQLRAVPMDDSPISDVPMLSSVPVHAQDSSEGAGDENEDENDDEPPSRPPPFLRLVK